MESGMNVFLATWSTIVGLALMLVGGLVLWAYGGRRASSSARFADVGPEAEATRRFHQRLARWFFIYGSLMIALGLALLLWAAQNFYGN
jgi:hypothetical protein